MEMRKRNTHRGSSSSNRRDSDDDVSGNVKAEQLDRRFTRIILVVFGLLGVSLTVSLVHPEGFENVLSHFGVRLRHHAVVIDAGSTGSRVLAFTFHRGVLDRQLVLVDELWREVKPGISSYADEPKKASESIHQLLAMAKERIPQPFWGETSVILKATAGLRLLPAEKANAINQEIEKTLVTSGFHPETPLVEIMDPRDEGLFGWFTVNFLLDVFAIGGDLSKSFVTLDLGGGSTQITFAPQKLPVEGLEGRADDFMYQVTILGREQNVYTHSYLGLGLMAARKSIFTHEQDSPKTDNKNNLVQLKSPCMASAKLQTWSYQGITYEISSTPDNVKPYENCLGLVRKVIAASEVHRPAELRRHSVAVFSYFYDRAVDSGILQAGVTEGLIRVSHFIEAANKACWSTVTDEASFLCVDLTFIVSLLIDGYGLGPETSLHVFKKIRGHEASWALGVAYSLVEGR